MNFVPLRGRPGALIVPADLGNGPQVGAVAEEEVFVASFERRELGNLLATEGNRRVEAILGDLRTRLCGERGITDTELREADKRRPMERVDDRTTGQVFFRQVVEQ